MQTGAAVGPGLGALVYAGLYAVLPEAIAWLALFAAPTSLSPRPAANDAVPGPRPSFAEPCFPVRPRLPLRRDPPSGRDLDDGTVSQLLEELAGEMNRPSDRKRRISG